MTRQIMLNGLRDEFEKAFFQDAVVINDVILMYDCLRKPPKYAKISELGLMWNSYDEYRKDGEENCKEFLRMFIYIYNGWFLAPCHALEIYELHIDPYKGKKIE